MNFVNKKERLIEKLELELSSNLSELILIPNIKELLIENIKIGAFFDNPKGKNNTYILDLNIINKAIQKFNLKLEDFFDKSFTTFGFNKTLYVTINDDFQVNTQYDKNTKNTDLAFELMYMLPDSSIFDTKENQQIFKSKDDFHNLMDLYDDWIFLLNNKMYKKTVQIGGYGRWIQDNYNGKYVGQLNLNLGDSGSAFLLHSKQDNKGYIFGHVDMY